MERVLIAVDDSVESLMAARNGARLAAGWNAAVRVLTAIPGGLPDAAAGLEASQLVDHVVGDARAAEIAADKIDSVVRAGEPFRQILKEAHAWHADLIVMGVSHRTGLRSPYVGSQTEHVLEFAECPVLVVPGSASRNE